MDKWQRIQDIAEKNPVIEVCFIESEGYPMVSQMYVLQSKHLGRFVVSGTKESKKDEYAKLHPQQTWNFKCALDFAIVQGDVEVLEFKGNEKVFLETFVEDLKKYSKTFDDPNRVLLVMNAKRISFPEKIEKIQ
uniref:Pyridoxamine 5'-phosphate oxidase n=1 Tax=Trepomonas sp. PC1 TaxID=1076344 RepID=A0A146KDG5_9EUKA|eukprot:JAP93536.1 Hypothetical protein TPC1_14154 [Trepomonas sp. PC1]